MTKRSTNRLYVSVEEAAELLGISRGTAYKLCHSYLQTGQGIPCMRLGARILVRLDELDKLFRRPPDAA